MFLQNALTSGNYLGLEDGVHEKRNCAKAFTGIPVLATPVPVFPWFKTLTAAPTNIPSMYRPGVESTKAGWRRTMQPWLAELRSPQTSPDIDMSIAIIGSQN